MTRVSHIKCDRCGLDKVDEPISELRAWAKISYSYLIPAAQLEWELCPNCRLLYEAAMVELRLMQSAKNKTQFALEIDLAQMVENKVLVQCPQCRSPSGSHRPGCVYTAYLCEHANEVPQSCPCEAGCFCRGRMCPR